MNNDNDNDDDDEDNATDNDIFTSLVWSVTRA